MGRNCREYCTLQCKVGHAIDVWDCFDLDDYINEPGRVNHDKVETVSL